MEKLNCFILFLFLLISCNKKEDGFIEFKDEIKPEMIKSVSMDRGVLKLNKKYLLNSNSALLFKDTFPKWITDKGAPDYSFKKYIFEPYISDIDAPYILYKKKNEDILYLVKFGDTLRFKLGEF